MGNNKLERSLNAHDVSRRDVLRVFGITASGVAIGQLLAACGGDDDDSGEQQNSSGSGVSSNSTPGSDASAPTATTGPEGTNGPAPTATVAQAVPTTEPDAADRPILRVGVQGLPPTLDPDIELSNVGTRVTYSLFDHLLERNFVDGDPPGTGSGVLPMLAESWEREDDLTLVMKLRNDIVFHNGDPLKAEDIKFTFERLLIDPNEDLVDAQGYVSTISSMDVVDDYTIKITTAKPDPLLEIRLTSWASWILPKAYYEEVGFDGFKSAPIGTGPYKFVELRPDDALILESHDEWWGGLPTASRVEFRVIPELASRVAALISGEVDIITNLPPDQVDAVNSASGVEVRGVPLANCHVLRYNTHHPPLGNKLLRQAMNMAIDRELLVESLWGGGAVLMRSHQFPEYAGEIGGDQYNEDRPYLPFDPEHAKELLAESGYDDEGVEFRSEPSYYTNGAEAAQAIVQMWQDVGINASINIVEDTTADGVENVQVANWSNSSFVADPDGAFWLRWGEPTATQRDYWTPENTKFNDLGNAARETLDVQARYDAYQEMLDIWEDEAPGTVLYTPIVNYGVRTDLEWLPYSFYYMDLRPDNLKF